MNGKMIFKHFMIMFHSFRTLEKKVIHWTESIMMETMSRVMSGGLHIKNRRIIKGAERRLRILSVEMIVLKDREAWIEHRMNYIGGSEASAIVGCNPYMSNVELYMIKTGQATPEDISDKPYVQYGIAAEPLIREIFKLNYPQYEVFYEENNSFTNNRFPWAAASLDGWLIEKESGRKGILEIKTSEIVSSMHKEKWKCKIPDNYYCQLLHYFMVREDCEFAHLTALLTWKFEDKEIYQQLRNYHIERSDVEEDIKFLQSSEKEFWKQVQERKRPGLILPNI